MRSFPVKLGLSLFFTGLAAALAWYGLCAYQVHSENLTFLQAHPGSRLFPKASRLLGIKAQFEEMQPKQAKQCFLQAISRQPLLFPAWFDLVRLELLQNQRRPAQEIQARLTTDLTGVSTWKWKQLLLAYDLGDSADFSQHFNFILARIPGKINEACYLARQLFGSWEEAAARVSAANLEPMLRRLMRVNEIDTALTVWQRITDPDPKLNLTLCTYLLRHKRLKAAEQVWLSDHSNEHGVFNPGFEQPLMNRAFGWRLGSHPDVRVQREVLKPHSGGYCLRLSFLDRGNVRYRNLSQIVPVKPDKTYRLTWYQRSQGITTDQGPFLEVRGYDSSSLTLLAPQVRGSQGWTKKTLTFTTPKDCRAVVLRIRRKQSLKLDNSIAGDYWLDDLRLKES